MDTLRQDLRYALRTLTRHPAFAIIAGLTLALGIGATTSIFTVVDGVLLRRAPLAGMERLMVLWETDRHSSTTREPASVPDYLDFIGAWRVRGAAGRRGIRACASGLVRPSGRREPGACDRVRQRRKSFIGARGKPRT